MVFGNFEYGGPSKKTSIDSSSSFLFTEPLIDLSKERKQNVKKLYIFNFFLPSL